MNDDHYTSENTMPVPEPGFVSFQSWSGFLEFLQRQERFFEKQRAKYAGEKPLDIQELLNRPVPPEERARRDAELAKYTPYYRWLNDNRDRVLDHSYRPGFDGYIDFFLEKHHCFQIDHLSVVGTYEITPNPKDVPMELPIIQIRAGDLVLDIVHDFMIPPETIVRLNRAYEPCEVGKQFLSQTSILPDLLGYLPRCGGEQTILAIDSFDDLYGMLSVLLGKQRDE